MSLGEEISSLDNWLPSLSPVEWIWTSCGRCSGWVRVKYQHGQGEGTGGGQLQVRERGASFLAFTPHFPPSLRLAQGHAHGAGHAWMVDQGEVLAREASSFVASTHMDGTQVEVTWEWVASHVPSLAYWQVIFELLSYMW